MRVEAKEAPAPSAELAVVSAVTTIVAVDFFKAGGSKEILAQLKDEVRKQAASLDISTETGRKAIASLAYKVARSKTALDEQGEKLGEDLRKAKEAIDAERRYVRTELDGLKDEVRKPLTEWENAEKMRIAGHEGALAAIAESPEFGLTESSAELRNRLEFLNNFPVRDWQEFKARADKAISDEILRTEGLLARAEKREATAAEAARLAEEAREQAIRAREEAAARAAKEAAERRAEEQARIAREAADKERQRVESERAEAEARAKQAEARRVADEHAASRRAKEAEERAAREQEAAIEAERKRVAEEARKTAEEAEKRAKNRAHLAAINREVLAALVALGASDELGKAIIGAIAKGDVPHTTINY